jgi:hypothetical protein
MQNLFSFQQGTESRVRQEQESPLLGRFRALPSNAFENRRQGNSGGVFGTFRSRAGSLGRRTLGWSGNDSTEDVNDIDDSNLIRDLLVDPKDYAVKRAIDSWFGRWMLMAVLPAAIVSLFL